MKFRILILFAVFAFALGQVVTDAPTTAPTTQTPASTAAPTTTPPTTAPPTTAPTTTAPPTTAPPTTAPPTTAPPTTAPPTTAPPTTAPPTTPAGPTTPAPTPIPAKSEVYTWALENPENPDEYCVLLKAGIQFGIVYLTSDGYYLNATIDVPENASIAVHNCSKKGEDQDFGLSWNSSNDKPYTLAIKFSPVENGDKGYSLSSIRLDYEQDAAEFTLSTSSGPGVSQNLNISVDDYELQSLQDSYMCMEDVYVNLTEHESNTDTVRFSDLQFLSYGTQTKEDDFGYATECDADFTNSDIVPIAVGCALAALVVIVLIAYLIGRKRSRQKGYQSV